MHRLDRPIFVLAVFGLLLSPQWSRADSLVEPQLSQPASVQEPRPTTVNLPDALKSSDPIIRWEYVRDNTLPLEIIRHLLHDPHPRVRDLVLGFFGEYGGLQYCSLPKKLTGLLAAPSSRRELVGLIEEFPTDGNLKQCVLSLLTPWPDEQRTLANRLADDADYSVQLAATLYRVARQSDGAYTLNTPEDRASWSNWSQEQRQAALVTALQRPSFGKKAIPYDIKTALFEFLIGHYEASDPQTRRLIALLAAKNSSSDFFKAMAKDADPVIQYLALQHLRSLPVETQRLLVSQVLEGKDNELRLALLSGIDENSPLDILDKVASLCDAPDMEVRAQALGSLQLDFKGTRCSKQRMALIGQILENDDADSLLPEPNWITKLEIARSPAFIALIERFMASPNGFYREWGVRAQPVIPDDLRHLSRMIHDPSWRVRSFAMEKIAERNSDEARKLLETFLSRTDAIERKKAIGSLASIGMKKSWPAIAARLTDPDKDVRAAAVNALGDLGATEAGPQLAPMLGDNDSFVRYLAVDAIGKLGLVEYAPGLVKLLSDADPKVQIRVLDSLTKLEFAQVEQAVFEGLRAIERNADATVDQKKTYRDGAFDYLASFATRKSIPNLIAAIRQERQQSTGQTAQNQRKELKLGDDSGTYKAKAITALARLNAQEAVPSLIQALGDPNDAVAIAARDALVTLKAADAWPDLVKAAQQRDLNVIEALIDLGRIEDAVPALLNPQQSHEQLLSRALDLLLVSPLQSYAVLEPLIDYTTPDGKNRIVDAWFVLALSASPKVLELFDVKLNSDAKFVLKVLSLSSESDRRLVLDRLTRKLSLTFEGMEFNALAKGIMGDEAWLRHTLSRDPNTLTEVESFTVVMGAIYGRVASSDESKLIAVVTRDGSKDADFIGLLGLLSRDSISDEIQNLPPEQLGYALRAAPRYGPAWLKAYAGALSRAGENDATVLSAAVERRWVTEGVDPARFVADTKTLLQETKHPQPELVWLIADILKEIGEFQEAARWLDSIDPKARAVSPIWLMLEWQKAEVLWHSKAFDRALDVIGDIENTRIPGMTRDEKRAVYLPINAYTLMLKGAILSDKGDKAEAVRVLFTAEDRLKGWTEAQGVGGDVREIYERVVSMIRAYRGQAQRASAVADSKAALSYFDQAEKSESTLIERDAETRALETQIRLSLGDGDFEEAQRLTERLALRRYSVQPGTGLASRSPERQAALDTVKQLKSDIREVEEKIRAMTPPPGAAKDKAGGRNGPAGESSAGQAPADGAASAGSAGESGLLSILQKKRSTAQRKLKQYFTELKRSRPEVASLVGAEPTELAHIQKSLATDQAMIQYLILDDRGWAFIATHDNLDVVDLKVSRAELVNMIGRYRIALQQQTGRARGAVRTISGATGDANAGQWIAERLVVPVLKHAEGARQLIIVPQGDLHSIPFAALPYRNGYLVESYVVSQLPSASLWNLTSQERGGVGQLLALGNPVPPSKEWSDLPGAEAEVKVIAKKFPARAVETHVRGAATGKLLTERSLAGQALHLALHGEAGSVNNTRLVMSDGYLGVQEIWGLALENSPLVVLSACETAVGEQLPGDEVTSLTNGFLFSGARSVIGSLWKVPDEPTMQLFSSFYDYLLQGKSTAEALASAQRSLIKDGLAPMAWGAFVVAGR